MARFPRMPRRRKLAKAPQRKSSVRARIGRVALLAACALLLAAPIALLAHPISYVPPLAAVLLVGVSWLYLLILRRSLSVSLDQMVGSCERGQDAALSVTLRNASPLPFPRIDLEFFVTDLFGGYDDVRTFTCALRSREEARFDFSVRLVHLGTYQAGVSRVVVHDLLGLFSASLPEGSRRQVVVRPRRVDMDKADTLTAVQDETRSMLRPVVADDVDYASVREYRYGDPMKIIHWNLSARNPTGKLYTRLFETYVNPSLAIIVDPYAPDLSADDLMSLFDGMVEVACALSARARSLGMDAEVRYLRSDGEPASAHVVTASDADDLVASMLRITPEKDDLARVGSAEDMLRAAGTRTHGFGNVALVTSRPDAASIAALMDIALRRRNAMSFLALPRDLEGKDRERFCAPLRRLDEVGAVYYAVESSEIATEVTGI